MEHTWRWFGPADPITLDEIRQTDATGVVTALHDVPNGQVWPVEAIRERRETIERAGLVWSVVESVPVHDDIKRGGPLRDAAIAAYQQTLRNLAACGLDVVCYNFMPVLDWTRTDLRFALPNGGYALRFDVDAATAFDVHVLGRPGAEADYSADELERARRFADALDDESRARLTATIIAGLPGAEEHHTLDTFRQALAGYSHVDPATLRENLASFLREVVPVAEEVGVRLAIHPDDPPRSLFGLPRVVSSAADARAVVEACPSPSNGLTLCIGSYGSSAQNDVVALTRELAEHVYFVHLRSVELDDDGASFVEAAHIDGDADMVAVISLLVAEERRREREGGPRMPMRPDHGHELLDDVTRRTNPGYSLVGRLKGLAQLRGVEMAVRALTED
jgi:mannonate dehydratase